MSQICLPDADGWIVGTSFTITLNVNNNTAIVGATKWCIALLSGVGFLARIDLSQNLAVVWRSGVLCAVSWRAGGIVVAVHWGPVSQSFRRYSEIPREPLAFHANGMVVRRLRTSRE